MCQLEHSIELIAMCLKGWLIDTIVFCQLGGMFRLGMLQAGRSFSGAGIQGGLIASVVTGV